MNFNGHQVVIEKKKARVDITIKGVRHDVVESVIVALRREGNRLREKASDIKDKTYTQNDTEAMDRDTAILRHMQEIGGDLIVLSRSVEENLYQVYAD
jgi:hypothetical protein